METEQKDKPEEDIKNKKLLPLLREAYALIMKIENKIEEKTQKITGLYKSKRTLTNTLKTSRSKSQVLSPLSASRTSLNRSTDFEKPLFSYKSIMCPLRDRCPNDVRPRWPNTETKSISKLGHTCPYAHHYSELHFIQEDWARAHGIEKQVKNIQAAIERDVQKRAWIPASNIRPCTGCGVVGDKRKPCNNCQLRELMRKKHEEYKKATTKKNKKLLNTEKQKKKKEELARKDNEYVTKFGLLKKAAVLVSSERWGDAHKTILQAVKMVKKERQENKQAREMKEKKVREKLGIPLDLEINYEELVSEPITKHRLERLGIDVPVQKMEILVGKMSGQDASAFTKNNYLNTQIVELYEAIDAAIQDKKKVLKNMKQKIESLESGPEDKGRKLKTRRLASTTRMCDKIKNGVIEKCTNKSCEYAHSAIELDFVGSETKVKNLQNTIKQSTEKILRSRAKEPWRPAKSGSIEARTMRDMKSRAFRSRSRKRAQSMKSKKDILERDLDREDFTSSFENI